MSKLTRNTALSLGLLGSLAMVAAPAAEAQVQVTGGSIEGTAAFFTGTQTSLFDIAIRNLQIVSPNGVLTNPAFVPTATGGYQAGTPGQVSPGDTGLITGKLSGIGFSAGGSLIPFSNVDTALAYNVGRFSPIGNPIVGSLISAASLPQLFIPIDGVKSSDGSVRTDSGQMRIGDLNANITAGFIDLPSDIEFRGSSAALAPIAFEMPRKIKFQFEGENVTPTTWTPRADGFDFAGEANKKFEISTFGNGRRDSFRLEASNGFVDITVGNAQVTSNDTLVAGQPMKYKIDGQTNGVLALFGPGQVGVAGSGRNTTFEFEQGSNKFKGNTGGDGTVNFLAAAGAGSITRANLQANYSLSQYQAVSRDSQFVFVQNISESAFTRNNVRFGGMTLIFNGSRFSDQSGSFTFKTRGSESLSQAQIFIQNILNNIQFVNTGESANSIFSGGSTAEFEIVAAPSFNLKVRSNRSGRVQVKFVQQRGRRIFVATRDNVGVGAFEQSGPGSRMFPGLFGVRQLSEEDAASIYELIDTLSVSEADAPDADDDADDVDVDDDSDSDDDDDDESAEVDDDAEEVADESEAVGPAFTGLDSLSDTEVEEINSTINSFGGEDTTAPAEEPAAVEEAPAPAEDAAVVEEAPAPAEDAAVVEEAPAPAEEPAVVEEAPAPVAE
ncbi:hypothetical protein [Spirulina sp. CCNP1310]|uniref:hypothetical protein n=1 Tax=Spirulina sp. CCNP1310 TaxID=3110249 RepID=UPI002B22182D|nr:hypothetical protein [Spirulina sp. CCNP1310]